MGFPEAVDGVFDGAQLYFDGYREPNDIIAFSHAPNRLAIVMKKASRFVVQFLMKRQSSVYSCLVWDEGRARIVCGSLEEASKLAEDYAKS